MEWVLSKEYPMWVLAQSQPPSERELLYPNPVSMTSLMTCVQRQTDLEEPDEPPDDSSEHTGGGAPKDAPLSCC